MRSGFLNELGLSRKGLTAKNILLGIMLFIIILFIELSIGAVSIATNSNITGNSSVIYQSSPTAPPIWFYVFVSVIAPIIEEITFRGLFVKRLGIIPSAIIFALLHSGYSGSISSLSFIFLLLSAFIFGAVAGYLLKRTKSIYPSIVAHILINTLGSLPFL